VIVVQVEFEPAFALAAVNLVELVVGLVRALPWLTDACGKRGLLAI
jgi:hypothetical protein